MMSMSGGWRVENDSIGLPARNVPSSRSSSSSLAISTVSGSTRSVLLRTTSPPRGSEILENVQVLPGLGHDPVIGGDHQQGQIHPV